MASVIVCLLVFCGTVVWSLVPQFPKYVQWMLFFAAVIIEIAFLTIWRKNGWSVIQKILMWCVVVVVVFLTVWWGYWYKAIYLNPWPDSNSLSSEFMRMSASYAKPFKTCQFIRDNKLSGKMFNYWTEGGFLAYGQNPDPNTGQTPLQLFMDGRAQAAYDTKVYKRWMKIMSGGTVAEMVNRAKRKFTASDYRDIGNWLSEVLRKDDVWVVVMPKNQFNSRFVRGLDAVPGDWRIAFMNDSQRIYVDIKSKKGIKLFVDAINGKAIFPDEYSKNLTIGYYLLRSGRAEDLANGFERVKRAFEIQPSYISTYQLFTAAGRDKKLRPQVIGLVREYLDEFLADRKEFRAKDGYRDSLTAATLACDFLIKTNRSDKEAVEKYKNYIQEFNAEQRLLSERSRW